MTKPLYHHRPDHQARRTVHFSPSLSLLTLLTCSSLLVSGCFPRPTIKQTEQEPLAVASEEHTAANSLVVKTSTTADAQTPASKAELVAAVTKASTNVETTPPPLPEKTDVWQRLVNNFRISEVEDNPRLSQQRAWYLKHPEYMKRVSERAEPFLHLIAEEVEKRNMPGEIALLPIVESAFRPFAYSHGRAAGLWQFVPGTGKYYGLKQTWWYDGRRDVVASTKAALDYLQHLHDYFDGDWYLALAAYNSGAGNVNKAIRKNKKRGKPLDFWHLDLPRETRAYVPKLIAVSQVIAGAAAHNIPLSPIIDEPVLAEVDAGKQIDLNVAAELAEMSIDDLYNYNPAFNQWATDPKGPHTLLLPIENAELFRQNLSKTPAEKLVRWQRHHIKPGQVLGQIARKYHTSVSLIKQVNKLRSNNIRAGQYLLVPTADTDLDDYTYSADNRLQKTQNRKRSGHKTTYVVQAGDTFWDIARSHGVSHRALAKWNGMAPTDTLRTGQKLVVWVKDNARIAGIPQTREVTQKVHYRVRSGDSLARISQKFRVSLNDIKRWNQKASQQKYLQPGQTITLYVDVTQQGG